jgi:forespore regulator of the sigma-K checkpoint
VSRFHLFKEIKKSLKRKRRHVLSLGVGASLFLLAALVGSWFAHRVVMNGADSLPSAVFDDSTPAWVDNLRLRTIDSSPASIKDRTVQALLRIEGDVELVLHRTYLCGEETRQLGRQPASEAAELLKSHRDWNASFDKSGRVLMEQSIDDLSPQCRQTAYIGMDKEGNLSLFDGPPRREKIIRTFFQLDTRMLETRLPEERVRELTRGIRVSDKDEYNSVLSTFNDFAS